MVTVNHLRQWPVEGLIWLSGLLFLAFTEPSGSWSLCPLHNLGFDFCPGCGLGRSVSHIFHGEWAAAWSIHPLGFAALPILGWRIFSQFHQVFTNNNTYHGKSNGFTARN